MHTLWNRCVLGASIALAACTLAGCNSRKSGAEAAVRGSLKDPDSARFGDLYFNEKTQKGCLAVNAKNSMGGYTGDQQAYVKRKGGSWEVDSIAELDRSMCREVFADAVY